MLPQEFLERMENMLGEEYPAFLKSYDIARYQALRLNPQKGDDVSFLNRGGLLAGACTVGRAWLLLHGKGYAWKTSVSRSRRILYPGAECHGSGSVSDAADGRRRGRADS